MTNYLSQFDLLKIRTNLSRATGERLDMLNLDSLLSALAAPKQSMFGQELHPELLDKAATLFFLLIKNHPFYDGNKRIALIALRNFLTANGRTLASADGEALGYAWNVATNVHDTADVRRWLEERVK